MPRGEQTADDARRPPHPLRARTPQTGRHELTHSPADALLARMTDTTRTLTSFEAIGHAGMMMPGRARMCCRMCR